MEPTTTEDTPVATPTEEPTAPEPQSVVQEDTPAPQTQTDESTQTVETPTQAPASVAEPTILEEEDDTPTYQQVAPVAPLDFSQLPVDENNLIDPNALAQQINQRIAQAEQNAQTRAQQIYAEQEQEKRLWDKTYEKYPNLKNDKELQSLVQQARVGEATDILSRARTQEEAAAAKLPTPSQIADKLFKHIGTAKAEGIEQANTNTIVQKSAQLETAGRTSNDSADAVTQARANINNPNKEVANKARSELLKKYLGM